MKAMRFPVGEETERTRIDLTNPVSLLISVARMSILQFAIMAALSVLFYTVTSIAEAIYEKLTVLADYLPILWRYRQFFDVVGATSDFPILFSISLMNIIVQAIFFTLICRLLITRVDFGSAGPMSVKRNLLFVALLALTFVVPIELIAGPLDLNSIGASSGDHGPLSPLAVYFRYCFLAPAGNIFFVFMIVTRFGLPAVAL